MKIVDKYFYEEMGAPIIFGISLFTFIFLIDALVEMMENIIVKNVPIKDVLSLISYYFPPVLVQTIPMGLLLGIMISYGKLSGNSEIIALESMGISMTRFLRPALVLGILTMGFVFFLEEKVVPGSYTKFGILSKAIAYRKPAIKIEEKVFVEGIGDYNIYINKMDNELNEAKNLIVFKKESDTPFPEIIISKKAKWEKSDMVLENANFYNINSNGEKELSGSFEKQSIPINTFFGKFNINNKNKSSMSITELRKEIIKRKKKKMNSLSYEIEYQQKLAIPISALILSFLGVLLSVKNNRNGKGVSFGISLVIIFFYIMGVNFGRLLIYNEVLPPIIGMWYPNFLLLLLSLILFYKQTRSR